MQSHTFIYKHMYEEQRTVVINSKKKKLKAKK